MQIGIQLSKRLHLWLWWARWSFVLFVLFFYSSAFAFDRIISLKPNLTEILFALGVGDKIVGVTTYCDFPPQVKAIDKVADYIQPNLEKLISKKPDLIVTSKENSSRREIEFLMRKGYPVLTFESETLPQLKKTILELGKELGRLETAKALVQKMDVDLDQLKKKTLVNSNSPLPRALFVVGHEPLVVAGSQNLFNDIAPYLGVVNVAAENHFRYPTYSLEILLQKAPDLILDFSMGSEASIAHQESLLLWWKKFASIPAVQNHKILFLDISEIRASPRLPEELEKIVELLHR